MSAPSNTTTNPPNNPSYPIHGSCACSHIKYTLHAPPLTVHCCHCTQCQRETGSAFAINAPIEAENITHRVADSDDELIDPPDLEIMNTPSASGSGQLIARCPRCKVAVWSNYFPTGPGMRFVRVGTLDQRGKEVVGAPSVHIFTGDKVGWFDLENEEKRGRRCFEGYYDAQKLWKEWGWEESLRRMEAFRKKEMEKGKGKGEKEGGDGEEKGGGEVSEEVEGTGEGKGKEVGGDLVRKLEETRLE